MSKIRFRLPDPRYGATQRAMLERLLVQANRVAQQQAAGSVNSGDFKGLRKLRKLVGARFVTGIVLYDGRQALSFGEGLWAVPLDRL